MSPCGKLPRGLARTGTQALVELLAGNFRLIYKESAEGHATVGGRWRDEHLKDDEASNGGL